MITISGSKEAVDNYCKYIDELEKLFERFRRDPDAPQILHAIYSEHGSRIFIVSNPTEREIFTIKLGKSKVTVI